MGANEYKWSQSSNNTTLLAKNVNSASFDISQGIALQNPPLLSSYCFTQLNE